MNLVILLVGASVDCQAGEADCFALFLTDEPPKIVETLSTGIEEGVVVTRLKSLSRVVPQSGRQVIICAVMARPTTLGPHPGLLVCRGGLGNDRLHVDTNSL